MASDILIVDDEADIRDLVAGILDDEGFSTRTARDSDSALAEIANRRPNLVFLDIWLQGSKLDGLQLLEQIKKDNADLPVVMISGHGNIETAVAAIKRGAYDFIEKPFKSDRLILVATRALETSRLRREVKELKALLRQRGLPTDGQKAQLVARIEEDDAVPHDLDALEKKVHGLYSNGAYRVWRKACDRENKACEVVDAADREVERLKAELDEARLIEARTHAE